MYIKIKVSHLIVGVVLLSSMVWAGIVLAGDPDSSGEPSATSSYSLTDLYQRLNAGTIGTSSVFTEPTTTPGVGIMHSINDIMAVAPALDNTNGATTTQVISGTTFWGLTSGQWGVQTGTLTVNSGGVGKTGQTACYNTTTTITCGDANFPGQDGDHQKGASASPRFTDNGNGTVTDNLTSLIWLKEANCSDIEMNWTRALTEVQELNNAGTMNKIDCGDTSNGGRGSHQTDWRLPNVKEYQSLIDFGQSNPALPSGYSTFFTDVQSTFYWSSTSSVPSPTYAWYVVMDGGFVGLTSKTSSYRVWAVRGGQ